MANLAKIILTLQDGTIADANGEVLKITPDMNIANVEIVSTSISASVHFEATVASDTWHLVNGINLETFEVMTSTLAVNEVYQIDLIGLKSFRVRVSGILDGEVSAIARVVS